MLGRARPDDDLHRRLQFYILAYRRPLLRSDDSTSHMALIFCRRCVGCVGGQWAAHLSLVRVQTNSLSNQRLDSGEVDGLWCIFLIVVLSIGGEREDDSSPFASAFLCGRRRLRKFSCPGIACTRERVRWVREFLNVSQSCSARCMNPFALRGLGSCW